MDLLLILFRRELTALPRSRGFYWRRLGVAGAAGALVLGAFVYARMADIRGAGLPVFYTLTLLLTAFVYVLAPYAGSASLAEERRHQLVGLLMLSDLSSAHIVLGKLLASLGRTMLVMLAVLPLFLLCISLGGVSAQQIVIAHLLLLASILFGNSLGLLIASRTSDEPRVVSLLIGGTLFLHVALPLGVFVLADHLGRDAFALTALFSPLLAMIQVSSAADLAAPLHTCAVLLGGSLVLLVMAIAILPRQLLRQGEQPRLRRSFHLRPRHFRLLGRGFDPRQFFPNPLTWREYDYVHGGTATAWLRFFLVVVLTVVGTAAATFLRGTFDVTDTILMSMLLIGHISGFVALLVFTVGAARMFNRERSDGTIEPLLCTPLSDEDIIGAKIQALYLTLLPWLLGYLISVIGFGIASYANLNAGVTSYFMGRSSLTFNLIGYIWWMATLYGYSGFCLYVSLRLTTYPTAVSIVGLFLWLTIGHLVLALVVFLLTFSAAIIGPLLFIAVPIFIGVLYRAKLTRDFRRYILVQSG